MSPIIFLNVSAASDNKLTITLHKPGSVEKLFFFTSGIITSIPLTVFIEQFSQNLLAMVPAYYATAISVVLFAPFIEEFAKAFPLLYRHGETERSIFTLALLVGLGFGITEFLLYVLTLGAPIPLRLPGLFFHVASTSITAYGIATKRPLRFYLIAVALHLSNNFFAILGDLWIAGGSATVVVAYLLSWQFFKRTSERMVS